ncbi:MAG: phosphotransferase [Pseudomonadales bacterium]
MSEADSAIAQHDLPDGLLQWLAAATNGRITYLERHVARREAWKVDLQLNNGETIEGFLRLQRDTGGDPQRLERETRILQAIAERGIPAPKIHAWSDEFRAVLMERDPGRSDIDKLESQQQQRAVMEDFMRVVARFHLLDPDELALDDVMLYRPKTARDCALQEVDELVSQWGFFMKTYNDPLMSYGVKWLERFAPETVARVSLLQGDTGPVNFMFQGNAVSTVIDWECGHYGDPLEDLGNIMVREFWNPCGGLKGLFTLYEQESGIPYDRFRAQYYAVQQNVRGMIPIHYVANKGNDQESLAWYLCYRYIGDRATAEMLAAAMNIRVEKPALPEDTASDDVLANSAIHMQRKDVLPATTDKFAQSRATDVSRLIECIDRRTRFGDAVNDAELDDLTELLGARPDSVEGGRAEFVNLISNDALSDEVIIPVLLRKAYRDEWLYKPATDLYPGRVWADID